MIVNSVVSVTKKMQQTATNWNPKEYKYQGGPVFTFSLPRGWLAPFPPPVTPLEMRESTKVTKKRKRESKISHGRPQKFFQGGATSTFSLSFSNCWRSVFPLR